MSVVTIKLRFHLGRLAGGDFWPMMKWSMAPEMANELHAALGDALDDARRDGVLDGPFAPPGRALSTPTNKAAPSAKGSRDDGS